MHGKVKREGCTRLMVARGKERREGMRKYSRGTGTERMDWEKEMG